MNVARFLFPSREERLSWERRVHSRGGTLRDVNIAKFYSPASKNAASVHGYERNFTSWKFTRVVATFVHGDLSFFDTFMNKNPS